jgi:pyruvate/2-oxoglutarate dehydrogenase complex dihydrolipoamide dehydrogenase (E3) component
MRANPGTFDYDAAIIGGGSGGYAAARTVAGYGLKTVVIEGGEEVGGLCILRGCMPTKALLYASEVLHLAGHAEPWGIRAKGVGFDFNQVMARKNALIKEFADYRQQQLENGKFDFVRGFARFVDEHTVEVTPVEAGRAISSAPASTTRSRRPKRLTARSFVIATGSTIAPSPLPQLDTLNCLNSDSVLKLERLPRSLVVLGGGAVAVEFAQFFARFGVQVTLVQRSPHILHEFDPDAATVLETVFRREGMKVYTGTKLLDARWYADIPPRSNGKIKGNRKGSKADRTLKARSGQESSSAAVRKEVLFEHEGKITRVQADDILFALGRIPQIAGLNLDKIGVQLEFQRIATNAQMQTSQPHIYAVGDCTGLHEIVHIAIQQGEVAGHNIARPGTMKSLDYRLLTEVIFTEPQIATVGLSEKLANVKNIPYLVASYPFNDHGKSLIMEARDGFVKLLAGPMNGEILGGCCVGPVGGELIHEIIAAMHKRMTVAELAAMPHYHPTLAEIWTYPAEELAEQVRLERKMT